MELLAPAGSWDSFLAAINNGADAVYLGGTQYSARQSAANFDDRQMLQAIEYAHMRDRKIYVTVNTLIDNDEIAQVLDYLFHLQKIGADAVIVQDMGLLRAVRTILPGLRVHASTQMTVHNQDGALLLQGQGVKRIVLARELSLPEISDISRTVKEAELEVFVHGALCYCYSGQCLFSSLVGGRSGNRGRCAQPCRLSYELHTRPDGRKVVLPDQGKYLLSPADLCLIGYLPALDRAGVVSLKIEGRMKRPEYVAVVTRAYRQVLDRLKEEPDFKPGPEVTDRLLRIFNRNFSSGYLMPGNTEFLSTNRPNNRGVYAGRVVEQNREMVTLIKLSEPVSRGDGLVVWVGQGKAPALVVTEMKVDGRCVEEAYPGQTIELKLNGRASSNDRVFKTHDEKLLAEARLSIRANAGQSIPVDAEVYISAGQALRLILADRNGHRAEAVTNNSAQLAEQHPLNEAILRSKLGRLGNTPFELRNLEIKADGDLMVPFSDINDARRRAAEILQKQILEGKKPPVQDPEVYWSEKERFLLTEPSREKGRRPQLTVVLSSAGQIEAALQNGADRVCLALEGMGARRHISAAEIDRLLQQDRTYAERVIPLLPRIHKPFDQYSYREIFEKSFNNLMIASWADLKWARSTGLNILADYSLNVFNRFTWRYLAAMGVSQACLSPELNMEQLDNFRDLHHAELIVHGDLILMQSQFCMLGGVLGENPKNCGAPCVLQKYYIKDSKGYEFPIETDADCRFYIFNSRTLCMIEDLPRILALMPAGIRIEARCWTSEKLADTVKIYREAMDELLRGGKPDLLQFKQELSLINNAPFTKGHYYRGVL